MLIETTIKIIIIALIAGFFFAMFSKGVDVGVHISSETDLYKLETVYCKEGAERKLTEVPGYHVQVQWITLFDHQGRIRPC